MTRVLIGFGVLLLISLSALAGAKRYFRGETKSAKEVASIWGSLPFDAQKFKKGDIKVRSQLASSLMSSKELFGKGAAEIRALLGDWDGYYWSDAFPAYIIKDGRLDHGDTWQIVFLLDRRWKTSEIIVHKNCCDK